MIRSLRVTVFKGNQEVTQFLIIIPWPYGLEVYDGTLAPEMFWPI